MADIQNTRRQGTAQTWKEAYQDVDKTVSSIRDLNEDFASFVADFNEFSEYRKQSFQEYLNNLDDVSEHWEEINKWIQDNTSTTGEYAGSLGNIRSIFHDISALVGGIKRETADRLNLARRVERLAGDAVSATQQEAGLNARLVETQRQRGTNLREQVEFQAALIAGKQVEFALAGRKLNLEELETRQWLKETQHSEEAKLQTLQKQLQVLQRQANTGANRALIRELQDEIKYHQENIEYLDLENLKATQGLEDILNRRKKLFETQRIGRKGTLDEEHAGENAMPKSRIDTTAKILKKVGQSEIATKLQEDYDKWVTDRVDAIERLEAAERHLTQVQQEAEIRRRDLAVQTTLEFNKNRNSIEEAVGKIWNLLEPRDNKGKFVTKESLGLEDFNALTDELQKEILQYREQENELSSLREQQSRAAAEYAILQKALNTTTLKGEAFEELRVRTEKAKRSSESLTSEINNQNQVLQTLKSKFESIKLESRFTDFNFSAENLAEVTKSIDNVEKLKKALGELKDIQSTLEKAKLEAKYYFGDTEEALKHVQEIAKLGQNGAVSNVAVQGYLNKQEVTNATSDLAELDFEDPEIIKAVQKWTETSANLGRRQAEITETLKEQGIYTKDLTLLSGEELREALKLIEAGQAGIKTAESRFITEKAINDTLEEAEKRKLAAEKFKEEVFGREFRLLGRIKEIATGMIPVGLLLSALALAVYRHLLKFDEEAVKTKRVIGQWADASALANTKFVTGTEVLKTMRDLGEQFYINPVQVFSPEELGRISQAQKLTGMTAQAAGNLAVQSKITGKNADTYRDSIADGAYQARLINRQALNLSAVQNDVLTTSRAIALSYGKNTEGLARAAGAAAALGTNLQGVEDIAKNLMNFESSIEAEMQAQLLTGMQLNLAKAREYALNNDLEGVAREVGRQGMDAAKFSHMNYIQQENMAKALGMSREQMSKMLIMQEISKGLTAEEIANRTGMKRQDVEALSAQEKWQTMKQKFLESLVPLLEPVLQLTTDILIPVTKFVLGPISWLVGQISRLGGRIKEDNKTLRGIIGLIAIAIPAAVFRLGAFGKMFRGIFVGVGKIGKGIAGWVTNLISARKAAAATEMVMGRAGRLHSPEVVARAKNIRKVTGTGIGSAGVSAASKATTTAGSAMSKLGKNIGKIAIGAVALGLMVAALWGFAKACQAFQGVDWVNGLLKASAALFLLGGIAALAGLVAPEIIVGALALTVASALFMVCIEALGEAFTHFAASITTLATSIDGIKNLDIAGGVASLNQLRNLKVPNLADFQTLNKVSRILKRAFRNLANLPAVHISVPDITGLRRFSEDLENVNISSKTVRKITKAFRKLENLDAGQSTGRTVARLEKLASLNTGLDATATALVKVGSAVGSLASNLEGLDMSKLAKISRRFLGLSRIAPVNLRANLRVPEQTENTGESLGKSRENIETAVREVTVKQVESRASAQRVSVDQKTADLSKIEKKLDNVITAIKNSTPKDWNWLEFNRTQAANM